MQAYQRQLENDAEEVLNNIITTQAHSLNQNSSGCSESIEFTQTKEDTDRESSSTCESIKVVNDNSIPPSSDGLEIKSGKHKRRGFNLRHPGERIEIISWILLDATASVVTSVVLGLYPSFAQDTIFAVQQNGVRAFIIANAVVSVFVAVILVILGGLVDILYLKRAIAIGSMIVASVSCMLLKVATPSTNTQDNGPRIIIMLICYCLAVAGGQVIDAVAGAFLSVVSNKNNVGFISGLGYALGQITGVISLVIVNALSYHGDIGEEKEEKRIKTANSYGIIMIILGMILLVESIMPMLFLYDHKPNSIRRRDLIRGSFREGWKRSFNVGKFAFGQGRGLGLLVGSLFVLVIGMLACEGMSSNVFLYVGEDVGLSLHDIELTSVITSLISALFSSVIGVLSKLVSPFWLGIGAYGLKIVSLVLNACFGVSAKSHNTALISLWIGQVLRAMCNGPLFSIIRSFVSEQTPGKQTTSSITFFFTYAAVCIAVLIGCAACSAILKSIEDEEHNAYTAKFFALPIATTCISFVLFCIAKPKITQSSRDNPPKTVSDELSKTNDEKRNVFETEAVIQVNQLEVGENRDE